MKSSGANLAKMALTMRFIVEGPPRTVDELVVLSGIDRSAVSSQLVALKAEGLAGVVGSKQRYNGRQSGPPCQLWGWLRTPGIT